MEGTLRILNLEDNVADTELATALLDADGITCDIVRVDCEDAFRLALEQGGWDLILADVNLPTYDGTRALLRARSHSPDTPFVFFSGVLGEETAIESLQEGAWDYVLKNRPKRLGSAVLRAVRESKMRRELSRSSVALHASREQFQGAFEHAAIGMALVGLDGRWLRVNTALCELLGLVEQELLGRTFQDLTHPDDLEPDLENVRRLLAGEIPAYQMEKRYFHKSGNLVWAHLGVSLVRDPRGEPLHFVAQIRDITERVRAREELETQVKRLSVMYAWSARLGDVRDGSQIARDVVRWCVEDFGVAAAWIGELVPDGSIAGIAMHPELPIDWKRISTRWNACPMSPDPVLKAIRTGQAQVVIHPARTLEGSSLRSRAAQAGMASLAAIPMAGHGESKHALILGGATPDFFVPDRVDLVQACARQAALAMERAWQFKEKNRRVAQIEALRRIDMAITGSLDLRVTLDVFLNQLTEQLDAVGASVRLLDPHTQRLEVAACTGLRGAMGRRKALTPGQGHAGTAVSECRAVFVPDLRADPGEFAEVPGFLDGPLGCLHVVPLVAKGHVKGVIEVFHDAGYILDTDRLSFLDALAGQAAIAIDNASLFSDLVRSNSALIQAYETTLDGWSRALDLRDKETEGHTQRVAEATLVLATALGVPPEDLVHFRRGALLHDIGKMGVPDAILLKPGPLTDEEWVVMKRHPVLAMELLSPVAYLRQAIDIPYCHHEKWDGSGYPRGLKGEQIPLGGRIFAPIDVWDALVNDRPYRPAMAREKAIGIIRSGSGSHFDPRVAKAFLDLVTAPNTTL